MRYNSAVVSETPIVTDCDDVGPREKALAGLLLPWYEVSRRDLPWQGVDKMRFGFRLRNVTNALYAQWSDPGLPNQVLLGAPRTFELSASAKW